MTEPRTPIFDIKAEFDAEITIGDRILPIKVKRYTRTKWKEFMKQWEAYVVQPRGSAELTAEESAARKTAQADFLEGVIVEAVSVEPGLLRLEDVDVTSGPLLLEMFHAREEILYGLVVTVFVKNTLSDLVAKNSSSPRVSDPGSAPSQSRGGDRSEPTVESAEPSTPAGQEPATDGSGSSEENPSSSGPTREREEPIVH